MSGLTKRLDNLEKAGRRGIILWVDHAPGGGLTYGGKVYADPDALVAELGFDGSGAILISWSREGA